MRAVTLSWKNGDGLDDFSIPLRKWVIEIWIGEYGAVTVDMINYNLYNISGPCETPVCILGGVLAQVVQRHYLEVPSFLSKTFAIVGYLVPNPDHSDFNKSVIIFDNDWTILMDLR